MIGVIGLGAMGGDAGFRRQFRAIAEGVVSGNADSIGAKFAEFAYFLDEADRTGFDAAVLRGPASHLGDRPINPPGHHGPTVPAGRPAACVALLALKYRA